MIVTEGLPFRFINEEHLPGFNDGDVDHIRPNSFHPIFIHILSKEFVQHFGDLRSLEMSRTSLRRINADAFERCEWLEVFLGNGNLDLTVLPAGLFDNCHNLQTLFLQYTGLKVLNAETFQSLVNLDYLTLQWTRFEEIASGAFRNLTKLRHLALDGTLIDVQVLKPEWLLDLVSLEDLNLSSNFLPYIPAGIFDNLQNLRRLRLAGNSFNRLDTFGRLPSVTRIDMRSNRLNAIEPDFFTSLPVLHEFDSNINNDCINFRVLNVSQINFEGQTVFDQCFANWLLPITTEPTPSEGLNNSPMINLLILTVFLILKF